MPSPAQRNKRKQRRKKNRLSDVIVTEVSLVDTPAVPKSQFLIAKRDMEEIEVTAEDKAAAEQILKDADQPSTVEKEVAPTPESKEDIAKGREEVAQVFVKAIAEIRTVANQMNPYELEKLASLMWFAKYEYDDIDSVSDMLKSFPAKPEDKNKEKQEEPEKVSKTEPTPEADEQEEVEKSDDNSGFLAGLNAALEKQAKEEAAQEVEKAKQRENEAVEKILGTLSTIGKSLEGLDERMLSVEQDLAKAQGKA